MRVGNTLFDLKRTALLSLFVCGCLSVAACQKEAADAAKARQPSTAEARDQAKEPSQSTAAEVSPALSLQTIEGSAMGTSYHVKLALTPAQVEQKDRLAAAISDVLEDVENKMSTYRPDSELSRFNTAPIDTWVPVSDDTLKVVSAALSLSQRSQGAYDVTVGPLVNLWGFGPSHHEDKVPNQDEIDAATKLVGYQKLEIDSLNKQWKKSSGLYVDLSSIAKGFGVDKVIAFIEHEGIHHALVEIGGEIRSIGKKTEDQSWRIAIESPTAHERNIQRIININNIAVATSGDYRNYFEKDGKRYSHTIDPTTAYPITHTLASVSVVAESCMIADGLATTLMVLGPEKGFKFARDNSLAVLMIIKEANGFEERFTDEFRPYLVQE
jgi:thiamine biosynthesis lipoprotein